MSASTARHETGALLRAHLAAASGYRHLTRHCPICHRLLRLALEPGTAPRSTYAGRAARPAPEAPAAPENSTQAMEEGSGATAPGKDESPSTT